jgi:hypothetical protein
MARTTEFKYTNTSAATVQPSAIPQLNVVDNYAVETDSSRTAVLNNKTAPIDAEEKISYTSYRIPALKSELNIQNPSPVAGGILYRVEVQDVLVTTDTDFRLDEPVLAAITIRHPLSGNMTNAVVGQVVDRLYAALRKADGSWRFDDLMRSAERPVNN